MAPARLFTGENLSRRGAKQGDQFGERCRKLMLKGNLPDPGVTGIGQHRIRLPKNVQPHVLIGRVGGMLVRIPV